MKHLGLLLIFFSGFAYSFQLSNEPSILPGNPSAADSTAVFQILKTKCNECHQRKKAVIFTPGNMDTHASDIYKQVFVKKRMPKGKEVVLTEKEYQILNDWLKNLAIVKP